MKIAVGNSRMDKKWKNRDISWEDLCARVGSTIRTTETVEEYRKLKKGAQDNIKDVGGFVGGQLREGRRKNGMVLCRSMLTLDMDYGKPGVWDEIDLLHDFQCCVYSTHKHTPEHPRLRMIIPLARDITEEEYPAVARMVAKEIGIDLVDFKLEFGKTSDGAIVLADEISPDTCRLWDETTHEKLDKDRFRRDLGGEEEAYKEILRRLLGE